MTASLQTPRGSRATSAIARLLALTVATLVPVAATSATDNYVPFIEPLQVTQKRAYYSAAPSGQDEPLEAPVVTVDLRMTDTGEDPASRLETIAAEQQRTLSLEARAQTQVLRETLQQFGYDLFKQAPSTFAPVTGIPVPSNYRIGPGDNLIIQLFGKRNLEYNLVVTRDGKILIPEFGPVTVSGLSFDDAERLITTGFEQRVIGARAVVTMGKLRTIQVRLAGDVERPGIYTVSGLSSLVDALLTIGGVAQTGSLRDIQLIRDGELHGRLDLYGLLLRGESDGDAFLEHNDTIFVPALGDIVYIGGEVQRPAIYELKGATTLGEVVEMAGGLLPTASLANSLIERIQDGGTRTIIDFRDGDALDDVRAILAQPIRNGDMLRILPLEEQLENVVVLEGPVERPGAYSYREDMRLSTLLGSRAAFLPGIDLQFAVIERMRREDLRTTVLYFSPQQALDNAGSDLDLPLQPRDRVRLLRLSEPRSAAFDALNRQLRAQVADPASAQIIELHGAVRHGGAMPLASGARVLDAIALGGGRVAGLDEHFGLLARTRLPSLEMEMHRFSIAAAQAAPDSDANPLLKAGDRVYFFRDDSERNQLLGAELDALRAQARFGEPPRIVAALGEVLSPGEYPLIADSRVSDLVCAARGLTRKAEGVQISLSRRGAAASIDHTTLDSPHLLGLCAASRALERDELQADEASAFRAAYADDARNPRLMAGDRIAVNLRENWRDNAVVTLQGELQRPGVYAIAPGETLCQVLRRAGGLRESAYSFGASFTRRSVKALQQETLDQLQAQLDDLMVELSLSHSVNNGDKSSHEWAGKQDTLKVIRQLERAEATGRMVIDLDKVQRCRAADALVLEDGDTLLVPRVPNHVQVAGQVYVSTAHLYAQDRSIRDYVELSGGHTVLGRLDHTYVIQANGEVLNLKGRRNSRRIARQTVMPGARIYVPINVDRMNPTEKAQSWVSTLAQSAILAGIVL